MLEYLASEITEAEILDDFPDLTREDLKACIASQYGTKSLKRINLESTHFTDRARLSKLLALLALAFVWAMKASLWRHTHQPIRLIKSHGRSARSLFRYGFDLLRRFFFDSVSFSAPLFNPIRFLSCT
ncbi:DUF433 domain-containing protein [Spirulina sp.]|uniref:DUF433 domain-containing protein n=1 Tax=Spirulina sp. TaxID=1157 RepID=UPI003F6EF246